MTNLEIAKKILKISNLNLETEGELAEAYKEEFNDPIWYPIYLASTWWNDLYDWSEAVIEGKDREFSDLKVVEENE